MGILKNMRYQKEKCCTSVLNNIVAPIIKKPAQ